MSEVEYPISLPDIPDDLEFKKSSDTVDQTLMEAARSIGLHAVREAGEAPVRKRRSGESEDILTTPLEVLKPGEGVPVHVGSADPGVSGVRVKNNIERPDEGRIRAVHAIQSFLTIHAGRSAEEPLVERLVNAGLSAAKARQYLQEACDDGMLVKLGKVYKLAE